MKITMCYPGLVPGNKPKYGLQPLGILYIAAMLKREGFDVELIDADMAGLTVHEIARAIIDTDPDFVGFSMMTPQLLTGLAASSLIKRARPDLPIVLGGAHIDSTHDDVFDMADCFDFAVHGEGEWAMLDLCRNLDTYGPGDLERVGRDVPNVIYRKADGQVVMNPARPFVRELDELASVDYDMLEFDRYCIPTMAGRNVLSMMLSRGCPFKCTFCDAPLVMGKKLRFWSTERVLGDIRRYKEKYGVTNFVFKDSTFTANRKWAAEFCQALLDADLNIKWRCNTRANLIPPELLELMAAAGCYVINFGVESGHPDVLKRIHKEVDLEEVVDAFERCRQLGIRTYATFLMGNPGETEETAQATIDFSKRIRPSLCMFFVSTAYPGTPMYLEGVQDGTVTPRWWAKQEWNAAKNSAFQVRWGWTDAGGLKIPGFDSEYWQRRATREWYFRPRFMWDTLTFTLKNPYFIRHLWNLGIEVIPFYKLRNLLPSRAIKPDERLQILEKCPSAPNWDYEPRTDITEATGTDGMPVATPRARSLPASED